MMMGGANELGNGGHGVKTCTYILIYRVNFLVPEIKQRKTDGLFGSRCFCWVLNLDRHPDHVGMTS